MNVVFYAARYTNDVVKLYPLGIGYIAAYAMAKGLLCEENIRVVDEIDELGDFTPDVVCVSATSQVVNDACRFASLCKKRFPGCITVLGGYHISYAPGLLPNEFDVGVVGEGEMTSFELLRRIDQDGFLNKTALLSIPGLVFYDHNQCRITEMRAFIEDLDSLPFPYRHKRYSDEAAIFTSRGCPYACIYCAGPVFWRKQYRMRSAESVVQEIEELVETESPREIAILDDLWMADKKRFSRIVDLLEQKGLTQDMTYRGFCRSNLVFEEDVILMKRMNYRFVRFGAETASESLLKRIKGPQASVRHHQRTIDLCAKHRLACGGSLMFGIPGETMEDLNTTRSFLRRNRSVFRIIGFYFFNPIPGTPIWDELVKARKIAEQFTPDQMVLDLNRPDFDWKQVSYFNEQSVPFMEFRAFIEEMKKEFFGERRV